MYERFTDRARKVIQLATQEANKFNHEYIGNEHLILGLMIENSGVAANVLKNNGVTLQELRTQVEQILEAGISSVASEDLSQTPAAKQTIMYAMEEARTLDHRYIGTEHLLLGLIRTEDEMTVEVFKRLDLKPQHIRDEVIRLLGGSALVPERKNTASENFQQVRYSDRARKILQLANRSAQMFNHESIGTEHILLGLVEEGSGVAANVLKNLDVDLRKIRLEVEKIIQSGSEMVLLGDSDSQQPRPSHNKSKQITARPKKQPNTTFRQKRKGLVNIPAYSDNARKVMLNAAEAMFELKNTFMGPEHILLGILQQEKTISYELLAENEISIQRVKEFVEQESFTDRNRNHDNIFQLTSLTEYVMFGAQAVAETMGASKIDVDHLLLGILEERGGIVISMLEKFGLDRQEIVGELVVRMGQ